MDGLPFPVLPLYEMGLVGAGREPEIRGKCKLIKKEDHKNRAYGNFLYHKQKNFSLDLIFLVTIHYLVAPNGKEGECPSLS